MKFDSAKTKYVTVIIKCNTMQSGGDFFRKYRNVIYTEKKLQSLKNYLQRNSVSWSHFNLYDKETRQFVEQIKNI